MERDIIMSNHNPLTVRLSKLKDAKFRREESLFLCEGYKLVSEALHAKAVRRLLVRDDARELYSDVIRECFENDVAVTFFGDTPFSKISTERAPQGIIAVCETACAKEYAYFTGTTFVCSGIQDPGNLGTIIRSAAGFGYDAIILHECADIYNPKTVRASMGAIFRTALFTVGDLISTIVDLQKNGRRVIACTLSANSLTLGGFEIRDSDVFIVGNEGHGLDREIVAACAASVVIPMRNGVESFNAAMASSVIQWEQSKTFS